MSDNDTIALTVYNTFTWPRSPEKFRYFVHKKETGKGLKNKLAVHVGYLALDLALLKGFDTPVEDDQTLEEMGIKTNEVIHITRKSGRVGPPNGAAPATAAAAEAPPPPPPTSIAGGSLASLATPSCQSLSGFHKSLSSFPLHCLNNHLTAPVLLRLVQLNHSVGTPEKSGNVQGALAQLANGQQGSQPRPASIGNSESTTTAPRPSNLLMQGHETDVPPGPVTALFDALDKKPPTTSQLASAGSQQPHGIHQGPGPPGPGVPGVPGQGVIKEEPSHSAPLSGGATPNSLWAQCNGSMPGGGGPFCGGGFGPCGPPQGMPYPHPMLAMYGSGLMGMDHKMNAEMMGARSSNPGMNPFMPGMMPSCDSSPGMNSLLMSHQLGGGPMGAMGGHMGAMAGMPPSMMVNMGAAGLMNSYPGMNGLSHSMGSFSSGALGGPGGNLGGVDAGGLGAIANRLPGGPGTGPGLSGSLPETSMSMGLKRSFDTHKGVPATMPMSQMSTFATSCSPGLEGGPSPPPPFTSLQNPNQLPELSRRISDMPGSGQGIEVDTIFKDILDQDPSQSSDQLDNIFDILDNWEDHPNKKPRRNSSIDSVASVGSIDLKEVFGLSGAA